MLLEVIILILAIPVGFLIAYLARDELVAGRKWFKAIIIVGVVVGIGGFLFGQSIVGWTCGFILIVSFVSYWKSYPKNQSSLSRKLPRD